MVTTMQDAESKEQGLEALLDQDQYDYTRPRRGDLHEGVILSIGDNDIVVDLGSKQDGIIPPKDLDLVEDEEYCSRLEVGDHIPVVVLKTWGVEEGIQVSLNKGLQQQDWLRAKELIDTEEVIESEVIDYNRGGVLVPFGRLRGFVPNSHLKAIPRGLRGDRLREAKEDLIGEQLDLVVIEVNQRRRRLVLSERVANRQKREQLLEDLTEGEVRTGIVRNLVDFGAFVDLGGIDGLVHISELDWNHIDHPSEVLEVGDEIEVYVLSVDRERERIALSRKRLIPDPWYGVAETIHEGDVIQGSVTNILDFGVFVDVGQGVEGLIHNSELQDKANVEKVKPGTSVRVEILNIDKWKHQISLSLEEVLSTPDDNEAETEPEADVEAATAEETDETKEEAEAVEAEAEADINDETSETAKEQKEVATEA